MLDCYGFGKERRRRRRFWYGRSRRVFWWFLRVYFVVVRVGVVVGLDVKVFGVRLEGRAL